MQTFLPYADFEATARCLDYRRLGKQRVECMQLLGVLANPNAKGWRNHPAAKMWRGHERALVRYGVAICDEWIRRGYRDTCRDKILAYGCPSDDNPHWIGDETFHASHRANLLRKDFDFYSKHGWNEDPETPYVWPSAE